jgi:hypothetical protein
MTETASNSIYDRLLNWAIQFSQQHDPQPVDGEYYSLPGQTVYTSARLKLPEKGRIEVNLTEAGALSSFSWRAEITLDHAADSNYQHFLLQTDGQIVETYGKQVIPVPEAEAEQTLQKLITLSRE